MTKIKEIRCELERISVIVDQNNKAPKFLHDGNGIVFVDSKLILLGKSGNYKISWKNVTSLVTNETGFALVSHKHTVEAVGPLQCKEEEWATCRKLLEKYWKKKQKVEQRKSLEQQEQEELDLRQKRATMRRPVRTYSRRPLTFLNKNEGANNWDSEDDEETFNISRPKRKAPQEDNDDDREGGTGQESPPTPQEVPQEDEEAIDEKEDAASDEELPQPRKKPRRFKKKRVQEDDSDDENLFGDAEMTTPMAAKRIVSPATEVVNRLYVDDDDDDDATVEHAPPTSKPWNSVPEISSFFIPPKPKQDKSKIASPVPKCIVPNNKQEPDDTSDTELAPPIKKTPPPKNFFAPKQKSTTSPSEETVSTLVVGEASQASTVIPSPHQTPPPRQSPKSNGFLTSSVNKKFEEDNPLMDDSPGDSRPHTTSKPLYRRRLLGRGRTYGSSSARKQQRDTATMALEFADAHASPRPRPISLNMSPNRTKRGYHNSFSPFKSPSSPMALNTSPNRTKRFNDSSPLLSPSKLSPMVTNPATTATTIPEFFRGIRNIGNTCYMNSSLQMLFSIPNFMKQLQTSKRSSSLVSALSNLFQQLQDVQGGGSASARDLKSAVDERTDKFRGYQQRDANEFLGDLLDTIHEELENARTKQADDNDGEEEKKEERLPEETTKKRLPTDDYFRLDVEVCLKCKSCGYSRTKEEMYRYLSLDIPQQAGKENSKSTVNRCLQAFFEPEDREINCEKCESGTSATQTMKILSRPRAILLHLKRFVLVEVPRKKDDRDADDVERGVHITFRKNKAPVELTEKLMLDSFRKVSSELATGAPQSYTIQSIVHHIGSTADSGHYTADALRVRPDQPGTNMTWVSFDDTMVETTSSAAVLEDVAKQKTAYMMLYTLD